MKVSSLAALAWLSVVAIASAEHESERTYRVTFMGTVQFSRLDAVNSELRESGKPFGVVVQDWDDVVKAPFGVEAGIRLHRGTSFTTGIFWAEGDVETREGFIHPDLGQGLFALQQRYETTTLEAGLQQELLKAKGISIGLVAGFQYVWLVAETRGEASFAVDPMLDQTAALRDSTDGLGWYLGAFADFPLSSRWSIHTLLRWNDTRLDGTAISGADIPVEFVGPAVGLGVTFSWGEAHQAPAER